jgi:hypothetical protein
VISLTKAVLFDRKPFLREILAAGVLGVTSVHALSVSVACAVGKIRRGVYVRWPLLRPTMRPATC